MADVANFITLTTVSSEMIKVLDTPEELKRAEQLLRKDRVIKQYLSI